MDNPKTPFGKVDAAANLVAQIRLAIMCGDNQRAFNTIDRAGELLHAAMQELEEKTNPEPLAKKHRILVVGTEKSFKQWCKDNAEDALRAIQIATARHASGWTPCEGIDEEVVVLHDADDEAVDVLLQRGFGMKFGTVEKGIAKGIANLAGALYEEYCKAVGGKAFNGDPLPTWAVFRADATKQKQSDAWVAVARLGSEVASGADKIAKAVELLERLERECMVPSYAHDAAGSCPICRLLEQMRGK